MPLLINNKPSEKSTLVKQTLEAPKAKTKDSLSIMDMKKEDYILCVQKECAYVGSKSKKEYLITGGIQTCIVIIIRNEQGESFLAHSDFDPESKEVLISLRKQINWQSIFSKFSDKGGPFHIWLIGGKAKNGSKVAECTTKVGELLDTLYVFSETAEMKGVNINIEKASILENHDTDYWQNIAVRKDGRIFYVKDYPQVDSHNYIKLFNNEDESVLRFVRLLDKATPNLLEVYNDIQTPPLKFVLTVALFSEKFIDIFRKGQESKISEHLKTHFNLSLTSGWIKFLEDKVPRPMVNLMSSPARLEETARASIEIGKKAETPKTETSSIPAKAEPKKEEGSRVAVGSTSDEKEDKLINDKLNEFFKITEKAKGNQVWVAAKNASNTYEMLGLLIPITGKKYFAEKLTKIGLAENTDFSFKEETRPQVKLLLLSIVNVKNPKLVAALGLAAPVLSKALPRAVVA